MNHFRGPPPSAGPRSVALSDRHRAVLAALADRQSVPDGYADVLEELVRWGWVMPSGELTGIGHRHAGTNGGDAHHSCSHEGGGSVSVRVQLQGPSTTSGESASR